MTTTTLRSNVLNARRKLAEGREKLKARHGGGSPGVQVANAQSALFDDVVGELFQAALDELSGDAPDLTANVALAPHGGYGRRDVAPYSDVDLMLLYSPQVARKAPALAERIVRDVCDAGLTLGHSARTPAEACSLARQDAKIGTSLIEARFLAGSEPFFERFAARFRRQTRRHVGGLMAAIERARDEERAQFGETVYLLEPNVKRSRGGLRDLQLLRWIGFARYGASDPFGLRLRGLLSESDYEAIVRALEFLLRLRNEMHFHAGKSRDVLDRVEQLRLAERFGYSGDEALLPVEQFMRDYFRHTNAVSDIVGRFVTGARRGGKWGRLFDPFLTLRFEDDYRVGRGAVAANQRGLAKLRGDLAEVLRLADLASHFDLSIAHDASEAIRAVSDSYSTELSRVSIERFISLLSRPRRLAELLRLLHSMGVLEKIVPDFTHARSLLQFNEYHKYTVDEHCLRAVECATRFAEDPGPVGRVYRAIKRKWLLHLALLLHDLGKGFAEDHSEVGLRIAHRIALRFGLTEGDTETLGFLAHKHLMMSHLAFRRDTSDDRLVLKFAVEVGSPETLRMLFVLTASDLAAVGPGVLNAWKTEVLAELYHRALSRLAGDATVSEAGERIEEHRRKILPLLPSDDEAAYRWQTRQLDFLPAPYLMTTPPERVAEDLRKLRALRAGECLAQGTFQADSKTVEFRVLTREDVAPGVFHRLTGALTAKGLQILSAEIHTLAEGLVFDRFYVHDPDYAGEPPPARLDDVCRALENALTRPDKSPAFRRVWRPGETRASANLPEAPTQIKIDNDTSDRYTVIDIFTADRMGLLYTISRALFLEGLSVSVAKIGTFLDQVVDVFYVTAEGGGKIEDEGRLQAIRATLSREIEDLKKRDAEMGGGSG